MSKKILLLTIMSMLMLTLFAQLSTIATDDFEGNSTGPWVGGWVFANTPADGNPSLLNYWALGTATSNPAGGQSMYITNDNGTSNVYTTGGASGSSDPRVNYNNAYIYRDIAFPAGVDGIILQFDIKVVGENNCDYSRVYLMPTSETPVATTIPQGNLNPDNYDAHRIGATYYQAYSSWTTINNVAIPNSWAGQTARIVFAWRNDNGAGNQPPTAIDNIVITAGNPPAAVTTPNPADNATLISTMPTLSWTAGVGLEPTLYTVYLGISTEQTEEIGTSTSTSFKVPSGHQLNTNTKYYWKVIPSNSGGSPSNNPVWSFTTGPADDIVTIGTGTVTVPAPINPAQPYSISQQIYLKSELATAGLTGGSITHIAFQANTSSSSNLANCGDWLIYMGETEQEVFATSSSWVPLEEMEQVYIEATPISFASVTSSGVWINIPLTTPFVYSGLKNLVIFVNEYTSGYANGASAAAWRATSQGTTTNRTIYNTSNSNAGFGPFQPVEGGIAWTAAPQAPTLHYYRPNIKLFFNPAPEGVDLTVAKFTGPAELSTTNLSITVNSLAAGQVDTYKVEVFEVVGEITTLLYTVPNIQTITEAFQAKVYTIPTSVYSGWGYSGYGPITLMAKVSYLEDGEEVEDNKPSNDTRILQTSRRATHDIAVASFTGPDMFTFANGQPTFTFTLKNEGSANIVGDEYTVELLEGDTQLATFPPVPITSGATAPFTINSTHLASLGGRDGEIELKVVVTWAADLVQGNNTMTLDTYIVNSLYSQVGFGNTSSNAPAYLRNSHTVSQQIYMSEELQELHGSLVKQIAFQALNNIFWTGNNQWLVYLGETAETTFTVANQDGNWVSLDDMYQVFRGEVAATGEYTWAGEWVTITLDEPFYYSGEDNLVVFVNEYTPYNASNNTEYPFQGVITTVNRTIYRTGITAYVPEGSLAYTGDGVTNTTNGTITATTTRPNLRIFADATHSDVDLVLKTFAATTNIPGTTTPFSIGVLNLGQAVATDYIVNIYEVNGLPTPVGSVTGTEALGLLEEVVLTIPSEIYNNWVFQNVANVTLRAEVVYLVDGEPAPDANPNNNSRTLTPVYIHPFYDIQFTNFTSANFIPTAHNFSATLKNNGRLALSNTDYTITLYEVEDEETDHIIGTFTNVVAIAPNATQIVGVSASLINGYNFTHITEGRVTIKAVVTITAGGGDEIPTDNTRSRTVTHFTTNPTDVIAEIGYAGNGSVDSGTFMPLVLGSSDSVVQSIYRAAEFGNVDGGLITHIMYNFIRNNAITPSNYPVNIYLANAHMDANGFPEEDGWLPLSEFTPVVTNYDLALSSKPTTPTLNYIWIPLVIPFVYTGGDLVIMTYKDHDTAYNGTNNFFYTDIPVAGSNISIYQAASASGTNFPDIIPTTGSYTVMQNKPQMRFAFNTQGYGWLTGNITEAYTSNATPMGGVIISQGDFAITSTIDEAYNTIVYTAVQAPDLTFAKAGYETKEITATTMSSWAWDNSGEGLPTYTHNVTMQPVQYEVTGLVIGTDDEPLDGVYITLTNTSQDPLAFSPEQFGPTDETGSFAINAVNGEYRLTVSKPGYFPYTPTELVEVEDEPLELDDPIVYDLRILTFAVSGTIMEADGVTPVVGATVSLANTAWSPDNVPSTAEGFVFVAVRNGEYVLTVEKTGYFTYTEEIEVAGIDIDDLEIILYKSFSVSGVIMEADGETPVVGATVRLVNADWSPDDETSDADGFEFSAVRVGVYTLEIALAGYLTHIEEVEVIDDDIDDIDITLYQGYSVSGVIMEADGETPVVGATVSLENTVWAPENALSTADGFEFSAVRVGEYTLTVSKTGYLTYTEVVEVEDEDIDDIEIPLYQGYSVSGVIIEADGETPVVGATVSLVNLDPEDIWAPDNVPSTATGFVFPAVRLGEYRLTVTLEGYFTHTEILDVIDEVVVVSTITLLRSYTVTGSVVRLGQPFTDALVTLMNVDEEVFTDTTDEAGFFSIPVVSGAYTLTIYKEGASDNGTPYGVYTAGITVSDDENLGIIDMTSLSDIDNALPVVTALKGNYPNPFNPSTTIAFDLAREGYVNIEIYNIKGQKVKTVVSGNYTAGQHKIVWNGDDFSGRSVGSGVYFYRMTTSGYVKTQKMLMMK